MITNELKDSGCLKRVKTSFSNGHFHVRAGTIGYYFGFIDAKTELAGISFVSLCENYRLIVTDIPGNYFESLEPTTENNQ